MEISNEEVIKKLNEFADHDLQALLKDALTNACLLVEADAKRRCPVDDGQLRQSITHDVDGLKGIVGTNVEYAPFVEIGTGIYSTEGTGRKTPWSYQDAKGDWHKTKGSRPQPFLYPALEENREEILKCFEEII